MSLEGLPLKQCGGGFRELEGSPPTHHLDWEREASRPPMGRGFRGSLSVYTTEILPASAWGPLSQSLTVPFPPTDGLSAGTPTGLRKRSLN